MEQLSKDVRSAIEKNLSSTVASELASFITDAERAKARLPIAEAELRDAKNESSRKDGQLRELTAKLATFEAREAEFKQSETRLLIASKDVEKANAVRDAVQSVVGQVFANTIVKRGILESGTVPAPYGAQGQYPAMVPTTGSRTETVEG